MEKLIAKLKELNGEKVSIKSHSIITKFTTDKIETYKDGGLLPNECRTNSQAVARFLGDEALVIEGFLVTADKCCYPHMWVKFGDIHIDLTLEIFGKIDESNQYFELFTHENDNSYFPKDIQFSYKIDELLSNFHKENTICKSKYDESNNKLKQPKK
jgi:hypothetical protein